MARFWRSPQPTAVEDHYLLLLHRRREAAPCGPGRDGARYALCWCSSKQHCRKVNSGSQCAVLVVRAAAETLCAPATQCGATVRARGVWGRHFFRRKPLRGRFLCICGFLMTYQPLLTLDMRTGSMHMAQMHHCSRGEGEESVCDCRLRELFMSYTRETWPDRFLRYRSAL